MCQDDESSFDFIFTNGNSLGVLSADSLYSWDFDGSYSLVSGDDTTSDVSII